MAKHKIAHAQIKVDPAVLPRTGGDDKVVKEYAEIKRLDAQSMPPPVVFFDDKKHWLADGDKRLAADKKLGLKETVCDVRKGSRADAIWFACQANVTHGTRLTSAQKRQAVENCLRDKTLRDQSNPAIAEQCGVGETLVLRVRKQLVSKTSGGAKVKAGKELRKTKSGKVMDTSNIGSKKKGGRPRKPPLDVPVPDVPEPEVVEPPDVVEDGLGNPVPEWLMHVWIDVARINAYLTSLTAAVVTPIQELHETDAGPAIEPKYVAGQLNEIRKHVRDSMPWSVCPKCKGAGRILAKCERCKGRGWLTRPQQDANYAH